MRNILKKLRSLSSSLLWYSDDASESIMKMAQEQMTEEDKTEALVKFLSTHPRLTSLGMNEHIYIVGGAVRDVVMGKKPKDIDLVVDSKALEELGEKNKTALSFGKAIAFIVPGMNDSSVIEDNYMVVHVGPFPEDFFYDGVNLKGSKIEIVRARKEKYNKQKGYKPTEVEPGTIDEDIFRRDFTINTLAMPLSEASKGMENGEIVDLTGRGTEDLKKIRRERKNRSPRKGCLLKTPLDPLETFDDDPSRILRAIRFAMKYDCEIDEEVRNAIKEKASELKRIPWEPIGDILIDKILTQDYAMPALQLMKGLGVFDVIAEISRENKGFRTFLARKFREKGLDQDPKMMIELAGLGLDSVRSPASGLGVQDRRKVRKQIEDYPELLNRVSRPSINMMDIALESGLGKKDVARVRPVVRQIIIENPGLDDEAVKQMAIEQLKPQENSASDRPVYAALFLTDSSKDKLLKAIPPEHQNVYGDHITVAFGKALSARLDRLETYLGERFVVNITGVSSDENGQAATISSNFPERIENDFPHITISTAEGVKPFYSNKLLSNRDGDALSGLSLEAVFDFYPRGSFKKKASDENIVYVFDFDDTLFWTEEWFRTVKTDGAGFVTDAGASQAVYSALRFIDGVSNGTIETKEEVPEELIGMRLKKIPINKAEQGHIEDTFGFQIVDSAGNNIGINDLKRVFSNSKLKNANIDLRGKYTPHPAVTTDHNYYTSPNTLAGLGANEEMMELYKSITGPVVILTARKAVPGMEDNILKIIRDSGGQEPLKVYTKPIDSRTSGKYKGEAIIELLSSGFEKVVFFDDNKKYIAEVNKTLEDYDDKNWTNLKDKVTINLADKSNKPTLKKNSALKDQTLSPDKIKLILNNHGMRYIDTISWGKQGVVADAEIEASQGLNVAAKIILPTGYHPYASDESDEEKVGHEVKVWAKINDMVNNDKLSKINVSYQDSPVSGEKHLPKIYTRMVVPADKSPIGQSYGLIVMEKLVSIDKFFGKELGPEYRKDLFYTYRNLKEKLSYQQIHEALDFSLKVFTEPGHDIINRNAIQHLFDIFKNAEFRMTKRESKDKTKKIFIDKMVRLLRSSVRRIDSLFNEPELKRLAEEKDYYDEDLMNDFIDEKKERTIEMIITRFAFYISRSIVPRNYMEKEVAPEAFSTRPDTESLVKTLNIMNENGVKWVDLKGNNIMVRPATGDIVLIDVGLYDIG